MTQREWPMVIGLAAIVLICVGTGFYLASGGEDVRFAASLLAFVIAVFGIVMITAFLTMQSAGREKHARLVSDIRNDLIGFDKRLHGEADRQDEVAAHIEELRFSQATLTTNIDDIKQGQGEIAGQLRQMADVVGKAVRDAQAQPAYRAQPEFVEPPANDELPLRQTIVDPVEAITAPAVAPPAAPIEQLLTSLEPIVDLYAGKTAHYRLQLSMLKPDQQEVPNDALLHHADRTNVRPQFDHHAAHEALGLLRLLRQRDPQLSVLMSLGASSLQSPQTIQNLIKLRQTFDDVSSGLVFEFSHAALAGLSERGLEGLASLARSGATLAMSQVAVNGIDAAALAKLNVRFLGVEAVSMLANGEPRPDMLAFAQRMRAHRIHVVATGVHAATNKNHLSKIVRYASGPGFALPRRVKSGVAAEATKPLPKAA